MSKFSTYVYAMGRGPSKGRNLDFDEAHDAMTQILDGTVDPNAVGALLMLMRYRGETPDEVAGFSQALRDRLSGWSDLDTAVDWPSYAAGRTRGLPWFLLSAKLVAASGHRVFLHGWNSHQGTSASVVDHLDAIGIQTVSDVDQAEAVLATDGIVYCPLEQLDTSALKILRLREVLGLRSAMNTSLRLYNPTGAPVMLQGVFHPSYRDLQAQAGRMLGQAGLAVIKGGGGEFEVNPSKDTEVYIQRGDLIEQSVAAAICDNPRRLADASDNADDLTGLWQGTVTNDFARDIVLSTAAIALCAIDADLTQADALDQARGFWDRRKPL